MRLEFATATRIIFGQGTIGELPALAAPFGHHALVVTGANPDRAKQHLAVLEALGVACRYIGVQGEPTVEFVREGAQAARYANFVLGFGGGSALDAAKAIAAVAPNSGEPLDYLEVMGHGRTLENPPLPFIAIPTTAGTGAEVTRNAVLGSPERQVKASIRSPLMLARLAVIDPELTLGVPQAITAATGLDTLTQLIESYVSSRANALTDIFCLDGLARAIQALREAHDNGANLAARTDMCFASLLSGMALANAGLGVIHGCAAPSHPALERYAKVAALLTQNTQAQPEAAVEALVTLCSALKIRSLRTHGLTAAQIPAIVEKAAAASSMKGNPLLLTSSELTQLMERAL
jgi:alcohol dehydrogenase class IV